jgi:hypothetical protein
MKDDTLGIYFTIFDRQCSAARSGSLGFKARAKRSLRGLVLDSLGVVPSSNGRLSRALKRLWDFMRT